MEFDERYGDPFEILRHVEISPNDARYLRDYADFLGQCVITMSAMAELSKLYDPRDMKSYTNSLPAFLMQKWSQVVGTLRYEQRRHPSSEEYASFVEKKSSGNLSIGSRQDNC